VDATFRYGQDDALVCLFIYFSKMIRINVNILKYLVYRISGSVCMSQGDTVRVFEVLLEQSGSPEGRGLKVAIPFLPLLVVCVTYDRLCAPSAAAVCTTLSSLTKMTFPVD
jgi:hypothetical protein